MRPRAIRSVLLPLAGLCASTIVIASGPAAQAAPATTVAAVADGAARLLAGELARPATRRAVADAVLAGPTALTALPAGGAFTRTVRAADRAVAALKGLPAGTTALLRVRLADTESDAVPRSADLIRGDGPLVAAAPGDDDAATVTAYTATGGTVTLATDRAPRRPVLVVEVDVAKAMRIGLDQMRSVLPTSAAPVRSGTTAVGYWATRIDAIRLRDDKEPWIKGDAEIFSIVGGFGLDGHVKVDTVQMPWLNKDKRTYHPNQLVVHFNGYRYNLADVVMMEDDGDTNYLALARAIASALLTIADQGAYIPLVNAILDALPDSFWTDDPDYVDSWYTLHTGSAGRLNGASGNGWMDVSAYWVAPL